MSSDRLGKFKKKIKFQNLNFNTNKIDRGRLQEIQKKEFDLENMVFWKTGRWGEGSTEAPQYSEISLNIGQQIYEKSHSCISLIEILLLNSMLSLIPPLFVLKPHDLRVATYARACWLMKLSNPKTPQNFGNISSTIFSTRLHKLHKRCLRVTSVDINMVGW